MTSSGLSGAGDWVVFGGDLHEAVFHFVEELTSVVVPSLLQGLPSQFVDHSRDRGLGSGSPVGDVLDKACSTSLNHFDFFHLGKGPRWWRSTLTLGALLSWYGMVLILG